MNLASLPTNLMCCFDTHVIQVTVHRASLCIKLSSFLVGKCKLPCLRFCLRIYIRESLSAYIYQVIVTLTLTDISFSVKVFGSGDLGICHRYIICIRQKFPQKPIRQEDLYNDTRYFYNIYFYVNNRKIYLRKSAEEALKKAMNSLLPSFSLF